MGDHYGRSAAGFDVVHVDKRFTLEDAAGTKGDDDDDGDDDDGDEEKEGRAGRLQHPLLALRFHSGHSGGPVCRWHRRAGLPTNLAVHEMSV